MDNLPKHTGYRDEDDEISERYADLAADAFVRAGVVSTQDYERARAIIAEEILVRRSMGDK
jgi:hypothetical protein